MLSHPLAIARHHRQVQPKSTYWWPLRKNQIPCSDRKITPRRWLLHLKKMNAGFLSHLLLRSTQHRLTQPCPANPYLKLLPLFMKPGPDKTIRHCSSMSSLRCPMQTGLPLSKNCRAATVLPFVVTGGESCKLLCSVVLMNYEVNETHPYQMS